MSTGLSHSDEIVGELITLVRSRDAERCQEFLAGVVNQAQKTKKSIVDLVLKKLNSDHDSSIWFQAQCLLAERVLKKGGIEEVAEEVARIREELKDIPKESLLALLHTKDLQAEWRKSRDRMEWVAECWAAKVQGGDPIYPLLESGQIDKRSYDLTWLIVDKYWAIWELIQTSEHWIKRDFQQYQRKQNKGSTVTYPFESASELFVHIVATEEEEYFLDLLEYREFSVRKYEDMVDLLEKKVSGKKLKPNEESRLKTLLRANGAHSSVKYKGICWFDFVMESCRNHAKKEARIRLALEKLTFVCLALKAEGRKAARAREASSVCWNNGIKQSGNKRTTYGA